MDLLGQAADWARHDPDPVTKAQLEHTLELARAGSKAAVGELQEAFAGPLQFGTAGLRGRLGPGCARMNEAVVVRATAGLMAWLNQQVEAPKVVVGCDARHGSAQFAQAVAEVVAAAGGNAVKLPEAGPTPVTAFAVRALNADAGVMVTASHNPAQDNGYKVYLGGRVATGVAQGVQIVPPADAQIAECIEQAPKADQVARKKSPLARADVTEQYLAAICPPPKSRDLTIVLTPMHGVGGRICEQALRRAGFTNVQLVSAQADSDPDFPTVAFPNPEEDGALELAFQEAERVRADLVIALDPDADRCALAVCDQGQWRALSGDETGALLGSHLAAGAQSGTLACSIVSSRLLGKIAEDAGLGFAQTLTGFKWIARTENLLYGYEEAIGHCPNPQAVRDKDGIATAVVAALLGAELKAQGKTLVDELDELARKFGLYQTAPLTFRVKDLNLISRTMAKLRAERPAALAGSQVVRTLDLKDGTEKLPPTDAVIFETAANDRVVIRPSGTEPKLKCYLEVVLPAGEKVPHEQAKQRLQKLKQDVASACGL
ncbi:phospho-sugar mutase [Winkia neuii]|uniref:phospho-sugar mutase n=1 Tax=Winkia neuii TaxID=33007 RepID=UPI000406C137|nr:phospho-sugar mutase [Winkia neuii]